MQNWFDEYANPNVIRQRSPNNFDGMYGGAFNNDMIVPQMGAGLMGNTPMGVPPPAQPRGISPPGGNLLPNRMVNSSGPGNGNLPTRPVNSSGPGNGNLPLNGYKPPVTSIIPPAPVSQPRPLPKPVINKPKTGGPTPPMKPPVAVKPKPTAVNSHPNGFLPLGGKVDSKKKKPNLFSVSM